MEHVFHLQPGGEDNEHGGSLTCWWLYLPNIKRNVLNICSLYKIINKCRDKTGSSWFNCALRGDEAVYWVSKGQQWLVLHGTESVSGGTSQFLMILGQNRACMPLYMSHCQMLGKFEYTLPAKF